MSWIEVMPFDFWESNPEIEGVLIGKNSKTTNDGRSYAVYTIDHKGEPITFNGSKILDARLEKCELGTRVKITFLGKVMGQNGEYRDFRVEKWEENDGAQKEENFPPIEMPDDERIATKDIPFK